MNEITIVGTGAMALLIGGRMAQGGLNVRLLGTWLECIDAINQNGIGIVENDNTHFFPAEAHLDPTPLINSHLVLVLVKSWQTERAASQLQDFLSNDGIALSLQNGLGNGEILSSALGKNRTALGVTTYGATVLGPGRVKPGGEGVISVEDHPRLADLVDLIQQGGLAAERVPDLSGLVWGKLAINVAINPLTGLLGVRNGKLLDSPAILKLMGLAAQEAAKVAEELGVDLTIKDPAQAAKKVAAATAENHSSMLQDISRGAPTEIDALCGAVVRHGKELGIPTPVNDTLAALVKGKVELQGITT